MTNEHSSLEKYTSHTLFSKGLRKGYAWEVSWRLNKLQHIAPLVPWSLAAFLSRFAGLLNRGSWGPIGLCWVLNQLTEPVCGPGLYNCLTTTCFLWASHLHPTQPVHSQGYTLISSTGYTCSLIDGWVGGQYVTPLFSSTRMALVLNNLQKLICLKKKTMFQSSHFNWIF